MIKILLADDHKIVLDGLSALLEKEPDMEVVGQALDGEQVLQRLNQIDVDVLVMDIEMPRLNGIEAMQKIRVEFPEVKVLILTMYDDGNFVMSLMKNGAYGYVLKNRSREALVGAIYAVHAGNRYYPPEIIDKVAESNAQSSEDIQLTPREIEIIQLICEGLRSKEIADRLHCAKSTVDTHRRNLMNKLREKGVENDNMLVRYAIRNGICEA